MLIDRVEVLFKAGKGGAGKSSFRRNSKGPDGGNGGRGGDIYVHATSDITLLNQFSREVEILAEDGVPGGKDRRTGRDGKDLTILLPIGTSILEKKTGRLIHELTKVGETVLLCKGGKGGLGNWEFRSATETTPKFAEPGQKGVQRKVVLSLKLIADFGIIGLPNAGKSSLLNELTNAQPKIADYPFTTLEPNLGIFENKCLADIPGLIEGASMGKGLGLEFLKHIEKVSMLIHCISSESDSPGEDYKIIREELKAFSPQLLKKKEIVLLTKSDLPKSSKLKGALPVSIYDPESIDKLKAILRKG